MRLPAQKPSGAGAVGGCEGAVLGGGEGRAGVTTGVNTGVTRWLQLCCVNWGWWWGIHGHGAASLELHPKGRLLSKFCYRAPNSWRNQIPVGFGQMGLCWCLEPGSIPSVSLGVTPPCQPHLGHFRAHPSFWFKPRIPKAYPIHVLDKSCSTPLIPLDLIPS